MTEELTSLKVANLEGVTLVRFREGSILDSVTTQRVARELYALVESNKTGKMILDFEQVRFLSSQTLGVLLTLRRKADKAGVKIVLAAIRAELVRVFEITNLNKMFEFYDKPEQAVEALGAH